MYQRNGKIDESQVEIKDFVNQNKNENPVLTKRCDIYSLGAIMYKLLLGVQPS